MNTSSDDSHLTASQRLRKVIRHARKACGRTQDEIDRDYRDLMEEAGLEAPKSIMTKVRDKRRDFSFTEKEAVCLARALRMPPQLLIEAQNPHFSEDPVFPGPNQPPASSLPTTAPSEPLSNSADVASHDAKPPASIASFIQEESGLVFVLDMSLTEIQFDRLTLAIPAYMMKTSRDEATIRCEAKVSIFPYQAELIMRAIYGGR